MQSLFVHFLPVLMPGESLAGGTAVIIDILRASSTITTALQNGARCVIPCGSPDEAKQIRQAAPDHSTLLGGERGGVLIEGFDCGNSPAEYLSSRVSGKTIAFTTTNGTKALLKSAAAETIFIGAFVNRQALVERLRADQNAVHLVCAGTDGEITGEDVLFAGAVVDSLLASQSDRWELNDSARIAQSFWRHNVGVENADSLSLRIESAMRQTRGGRNLIGLGYDSDIKLCSALDSIGVVPVLRENSLIK